MAVAYLIISLCDGSGICRYTEIVGQLFSLHVQQQSIHPTNKYYI